MDDFEATIQLVQAAKGGDRASLEKLFARYLPRVRQIVALRLGQRLSQFIEHEDVAQEVLLKVFQGLERFEERSESSFRHWLSRCVECEIVDQSRRAAARKRGGGQVRRFADCGQESFLSSILADSGPSPSAALRAAEVELQLEQAILKLPKHHREVVILRYLCEMPYDELAKQLGLAQEATARKACSRAVERLRELMEEEE
jgi:RNA polymerase sigma-70 factor (ECF subfamily)